MVELRPTVSLAGSSGVAYTYWVFPIDWVGSNEPGNYVFAKLGEPSGWAVIYVGETDNFKNRLSAHRSNQKIMCFAPTHVLAHVNGSTVNRYLEERDLIAALDPPANEQG